RAGSLQELVYKAGQAGVSKATVTITFDNSDKKQSPVGYDTFGEITVSRQVVIGGRNKYLINGCNANNQRVQDLFRSVQLNINNPHFLIMQGRITKVLNMKPPEILSMIEEAAGTQMYESKKQSAMRTIEKKENKLQEIETILKEEITPTLKKLKEEMSTKSVQIQEEEQKKKSEKQKQITEESGEVLKNLEKKLDEVSKDDVKANSDVKHARESLTVEKRKKKDIEKAQSDDEKHFKLKEIEVSKLSDLLKKLEGGSKNDEDAVRLAQEKFHAVSAGLSTCNNQTLADQIMACKADITEAETLSKQGQIKLKHAQAELKKKKSELKATEQDYEKDKKAFDSIEKAKHKLEVCCTILLTHYNIIGKIDLFPNLQFQYKDPEAKFDRRKVKGLVAQLIKVKDVKYATSLEVAAGGKLYNVVVDTEMTGKKLLQHGQLKRRYTIIPLNKISSRSVSKEAIKKAKDLVGKENVNVALSLVGYEDDIKTAISFVFGSTLVCDTMDQAKKVTFDPKVHTRSVTLEGDVFDPAGTLTGGARSSSGSILSKLEELKQAQDELKQAQEELKRVKEELNNCKNVAEKYQHLKQQYDLKNHEAELAQTRMKQSTHHHQLEEVKALENTVEEEQNVITKAKETISEATAKCKDLEDKMKEAKSYREKELKKAEDDLNKAKKKAEQSVKETKAKQQVIPPYKGSSQGRRQGEEVEGLKLEMEELTKESTTVEEQIKKLDEAIEKMDEQVQQAVEKSKLTKQAVKEAEQELNQQKQALKVFEKAISDKVSAQHQLQKESSSTQLEIKEIDHKISKLQKESKDAVQRVESMLQKYEWIQNERQFFGQANTAYDFAANDMKDISKRLGKLQETKEKLGKKVNMRAMNMLEKAEEKYNDLLKKKRIVLNDKDKIAAVIKELDEKKNEALRNAWVKVNKDFGSIFSTLLPGATAKLAPPEGGIAEVDGLEVKVGFGNVWKESLSELSGGQRSLVALSLILSLLLFKPAPLYILDEVDAALDLSHTQNIGQMLRTHFRHSQFIVVSLKDGMFNNANVLFKTKFVDGVSTVTRYATPHR
ncbi:hypothetical protein QZH41_016080, partial [Actinostola sp. cb2023]